MGPMDPAPSLQRFQEEHDRLWDLLLRYQEGLMEGDLERARLAVETLIVELEVHAEVEDRVLLPLFRELGLEREGAGLELFDAEHRKLRDLAQGLLGEVERLDRMARGGALGSRDRLDGIEQAYTFKHLLHHHTAREDRVLYPALGDAVDDAERARVWARMDVVEEQARGRLAGGPVG